MTLVAGTRFGPYEVGALLGVGGMGEVYRARDTRLGRDVAIKVLPAAFSSDLDRLARFEREARMLAALNHPRIAAIYGIEEVGGTRAIVLELVDGETLEQRLRRQRALTTQDALHIARQIADALDAAHEKGMVHRDLKPANVKVTSAGEVKVLDFGLAKNVIDGPGSDAANDRATISGTRHGVIVGTPAYMSPEQASGQAVDKRTDVWAFGCVLYEMLTGRPPFRGETVSDTIASVLNSDPDWAALPSAMPTGVRHLLRRCLERDPKRRLRGLGDIELALDAPTPVVARGPSRSLAVAAAGLVVLIAAAAFINRTRAVAPPDEVAPIQFEIPASISPGESGAFAISPDGRRLAFIGTGADGVMRMWERSLDSIEMRPIAGTEGEVAANSSLFWSPDSRTIGFYANGAVKKVNREGGVPQLVCRVAGIAVGGSWSRQGVIVLGSPAGLLRCPASGGDASLLTNTSAAGGSTVHFFPAFLPDDRHLLFLRVARANPAENGLYVADLDRAPDQQSTERILETGFGGRYVDDPRGGGKILFVRERALFAIPFSPDRLAVTGEPVQLASPIGIFRDSGFFDGSPNTLVYRGAVPDYQLTWRGRKGEPLGIAGEPGQYIGVALAPDDTRAAVVRENRLNRSDQDLWLIDLGRNTTTRFTSDSLPESVPAWLPSGDALIFALGHDGAAIWKKALDGAMEKILQSALTGEFRVNPLLSTMSVTGDGRLLVFSVDTRTSRRSDIWVVPLKPGATAVTLVAQEHDQAQASISPGGDWLAYVSNENGTSEVFVRPLKSVPDADVPAAGAAMLISKGGGYAPRWRADGKELFYQSVAGQVMSAAVSPARIAVAEELFNAAGALSEWGVSRDGQRFLLAMPARHSTPTPYSVISNWQAALEREARPY